MIQSLIQHKQYVNVTSKNSRSIPNYLRYTPSNQYKTYYVPIPNTYPSHHINLGAFFFLGSRVFFTKHLSYWKKWNATLLSSLVISLKVNSLGIPWHHFINSFIIHEIWKHVTSMNVFLDLKYKRKVIGAVWLKDDILDYLWI